MIRPTRQIAAGARREAAAVTERFTGIHIGSVEIAILPPPESAGPEVALAPAAPGAAAAATVTPLARGLTSAIGLRQS